MVASPHGPRMPRRRLATLVARISLAFSRTVRRRAARRGEEAQHGRSSILETVGPRRLVLRTAVAGPRHGRGRRLSPGRPPQRAPVMPPPAVATSHAWRIRWGRQGASVEAGRRERGADLVGQSDRHTELLLGRSDNAGRGGQQEPAADHASALHRERNLGTGSTVSCPPPLAGTSQDRGFDDLCRARDAREQPGRGRDHGTDHAAPPLGRTRGPPRHRGTGPGGAVRRGAVLR